MCLDGKNLHSSPLDTQQGEGVKSTGSLTFTVQLPALSLASSGKQKKLLHTWQQKLEGKGVLASSQETCENRDGNGGEPVASAGTLPD